MSAVGIVAEYNPFHNGHAHHIAEARRLSGRADVIAVMSGSFTQRGEPACLDKFTRARHALIGGADMVIELPDLISVSCAERFARGGMTLLNSTGLVDALAFGSECGNIDLLTASASPSIDREVLKAALARGESYPRAIKSASDGILCSPNDILAVEYLRAISSLKAEIEPFAIKRRGQGYNSSALFGEFASASAIREGAARKKLEEMKPYLPEFVFEDITEAVNEGSFCTSLDELSQAVLFAVRKLGTSGIAALADVSEGLENPIYRAALTSSSASKLLSSVKSKRYTLSRLRRILVYALLGTLEEKQKSALCDKSALYIRVLGVKKDKSRLLSKLSSKASLPIVISHSDTKSLPPAALETLEFGRRAYIIRALAQKDSCCADEFSAPLVTVR